MFVVAIDSFTLSLAIEEASPSLEPSNRADLILLNDRGFNAVWLSAHIYIGLACKTLVEVLLHIDWDPLESQPCRQYYANQEKRLLQNLKQITKQVLRRFSKGAILKLYFLQTSFQKNL